VDKTLKQKFRQPFGYYMEHLIGRHFLLKYDYVLYHGRNHADEWWNNLDDNNLIELKNLLILLNVNIEVTSFERKSILYEISGIVGSNKIEFIRIENNKLIVSEIKSQYGPKPDYRIEFEHTQIDTLTKLTNKGIKTSLIYCIALPGARFVEIPFIALYDKFNEYSDFNGKEFTTNDWADIRIRIPIEYREESKFEMIDKSLYNYVDLTSLFNSILDDFPNKFERLRKFLQ